MKHVNQLLLSIAVVFNVSCKKSEIQSNHTATLVVTNSVIAGGNVKLNTNDRDSARLYNAKTFGITAGSSLIKLYPTNNPNTPYFNSSLQTQNGGIYSLFLSGQSPTFDAFFIRDNIPLYYTDSSLGIRVVNLSPNSTPLNITLASASTTNIFSGIAYKQLANFIKLPLRNPVPVGTVSFQVRDAANTLLSTYTLPATANSAYPGISILNSRNRNITLVIKGLQGTTTGNDAFGIFPVANY